MKQHRTALTVAVVLLVAPFCCGVLQHSGSDLLAQTQRPEHATPRPQQHAAGEEPIRITVRPTTVAHAIDDIAGQKVRVANARVVGVFHPRAFLIEDASGLESPMGMRYRVLVMIDGASLAVRPEELVSRSVVVVGVARTLLGLRVSGEVPWPPKLDAEHIDKLEVRAGVLATAVETPEGNPLTQPLSSHSGDHDRPPHDIPEARH